MTALPVRATATGASFDCRVTPNAARCGIGRDDRGGLRVRIDAPPVDGAANDRLLRYLARDVFGVPRAAVRIARGERGRDKTIAVDLPVAAVVEALSAALGDG